MAENRKMISKKIDKAIFEYKLIEPGDKILLAVSGGKDSLTMAYFLGKKQGKFPIKFDVEAVYINSDFAGCDASPKMGELLQEWGVKFTMLNVPIKDRLKEGKKLNCYWCSTQRRTELLTYANKNGFNKIALGHHMDDILETFFMNMVYKSEMSTMLPFMKYDKYPQIVIRPLARVQENEIIRFAKEMGFDSTALTCAFGKKSKRLDMRKVIDSIAEVEGNKARDNIFNAMSHVKERYLPKPTE